MSTQRKITPQELPKLIAAAVEKALTAHPVTPEQIANLNKFPIRCGIFPYEAAIGTAGAVESHTTDAAALKLRPLPFGFILREFDLLPDLTQLKPIVGPIKEL